MQYHLDIKAPNYRELPLYGILAYNADNMKWLLIVGAVVIVALISLVMVFLNTGYTDNIEYDKNYIGTNDVSAQAPPSHTCVLDQEDVTSQEQPLQAQAQAIASTLIHAQLPLYGGQALYNQYTSIEQKISQLQIEAASCH